MFENIKNIFQKGKDSVVWAFRTGGTDTNNYRITKGKALGYYQKSLYLNRALNKRAEKMAGIQFELKNLKNELVDENNDFLKLLEKPNEYQTKSQFFRLAQKYYDIHGAVYIVKDYGDKNPFKEGSIKKLKLLNPLHVTIHTNEDNTEIKAFDYSHGGEVERYLVSEDNLIFIHNPSPANPIYPESLILSGIRSLETGINADEYQAKSLLNGGSIDTIVQAKTVANSTQLQELKESYRSSRKESYDIGGGSEPFFAGGDIDIKRLSLNSKELELIQAKKMSMSDIAILTGVPIEILGVTSDATYANSDASIRIFIRETIKPIQEEFIDVLNMRLIPDDMKLVLIDPVTSSKEDLRKDLETATNTYSMTINEKRERLGLDEIENGDDILVPFNLTPLGQDIVREQPQDEKSVKKKEYSEEFKARYIKSYEKKLDNKTLKVKRFMDKFFDAQIARIKDKLEGQKLNAGEFFNIKEENNILELGITSVLKEIFLDQAREHIADIGATEYVFTSNAKTIIDKRAKFMAESVNNTTFNKIENDLRESVAEQETRQEFTDRLTSTYDDIITSRAETIARTETHYMLQNATLDASKQNGNTMKTWIWSPGVKGGVRHSHQSMDGVEIPIDDYFTLPSGVTGKTPGSTGSAGEDINCQCSII